MMLAIVIPYYKPDFFRQTLQSLAEQTNRNFKVYIGDDASPQDPCEMLRDFSGQFDFTYHRFAKNLGRYSLTRHWVRCMRLAPNEPWVLLLGDDDVLPPEFVASFYAQVARFPNERVFRFATRKIDAAGDPISKVFHHPEREDAVDFLFRDTRSSLSEYVFDFDRLRQVGFRDFPLAWHADNLAVLECSSFGRVLSINETIVDVRISDKSISGSKTRDNDKNRATFQFYLRLLDAYAEQFTEAQKEILWNRLSKTYLYNRGKFGRFIRISGLCLRRGDWAHWFDFLKSILKRQVS